MAAIATEGSNPTSDQARPSVRGEFALDQRSCRGSGLTGAMTEAPMPAPCSTRNAADPFGFSPPASTNGAACCGAAQEVRNIDAEMMTTMVEIEKGQTDQADDEGGSTAWTEEMSMDFANILVSTISGKPAPDRVRLAADLARRFDSLLTGTAARSVPVPLLVRTSTTPSRRMTATSRSSTSFSIGRAPCSSAMRRSARR